MNRDVGYPPVGRGLDRAVRLTHRLTPADVERIVDALMVDDLVIVTVEGHQYATRERVTAALCGGSESDYA